MKEEKDYLNIKNSELKSTYADFSFSEEMQNASRNQMWKNKYGLWFLLSGMCDDVARQCYEHINSYVDDLMDIDTCTVHALKSIAESVDLGYLCKNIREDFPPEIKALIDLFSVPRHLILTSNRIIHQTANEILEGAIPTHAATVIDVDDDIPLNLLYDIKANIKHIDLILKGNLIATSKKLNQLMNEEFIENASDYLDVLAKYSGNDVTKGIENSSDDIGRYAKQSVMINDTEPNWFYLLINLCKSNLYNKEYNFYIIPKYFNSEMNIEIDLTRIFNSMINTFQLFNKNYVKDFIAYHFFNTIISKIKNDSLANCFDYVLKSTLSSSEKTKTTKIDPGQWKYILKNCNDNEFDEDEFKQHLYQFLNSDEIDELIDQKYPILNKLNDLPTTKLNKADVLYDTVVFDKNLNVKLVDFAKYIKFINKFINKYNDLNEILKKREESRLAYSVLKINRSNDLPFQKTFEVNDGDYINNYNEILYGSSEHEGVISRIAKELADISLNVSYVREQIKTSIQQYSFIGTRRIATDILTDFFIKNYTPRKEWGYVTDFAIENNINISSLFKPLSSLIGNSDTDDNFSIDVVEYYDTTEYLNIESDVPSTRLRTVVKSYEDRISWWIDSDNLVTSGLVSTPVYEDIYVPCTYFISEYNKRFWDTNLITIERSPLVDDMSLIDDYQNMYGAYFEDLKSFTNDDDRREYISSTIQPLFNSIWNEFALSAIGENKESLGEMLNVYKKYIGDSDNVFEYENHKNKVFPTIAPLVNIKGLVEVNEFDSDLINLAKMYYSQVVGAVTEAVKTMISMHDANGVPFEGWRQSYVNYHGYSTSYELAKNSNIFADRPMKIFEFDGPWEYSIMQKLIFLQFQGRSNDAIARELVEYVDIEDDSTYSVSRSIS